MSAFARATAVDALGDGAWRASCEPSWSTQLGPNGGYLAAIILRAMTAELDDPAREARSLTCHYLRPPGAGELRVDVTVERSGRSLSTVSARLSQGGALCVIAVGAFAVDFRGALDYAGDAARDAGARRRRAPAAGGHRPDHRALRDAPDDRRAALRRRGRVDERRLAALRRRAAARRARPGDVRRRLVAVADAAPHAAGRGAHDRPHRPLPRAARRPPRSSTEPVLAVFRSSTAAGGFFEEDGELWSADGVLLAHSRQLALLVDGGR